MRASDFAAERRDAFYAPNTSNGTVNGLQKAFAGRLGPLPGLDYRSCQPSAFFSAAAASAVAVLAVLTIFPMVMKPWIMPG